MTADVSHSHAAHHHEHRPAAAAAIAPASTTGGTRYTRPMHPEIVRDAPGSCRKCGMTLVKGDLRGIARAAILSRATMRNIRQNLTFAFGYNALGIPIAAGAL